jgi:uncharacterized protein DUF4058
MLARFPGMDPFIEGQKWPGFHHGFITTIQSHLVPLVRPAYLVDVEEYVFLARDDDEERPAAPDVTVSQAGTWLESALNETALAVAPVTRTLPRPRRVRQAYLTIRTATGREVVTAIEVLSPWNKTGDGRREYLDKRDDLLGTDVHVIELDLLRGGKRLPTIEPLPPGDYFALVSRGQRRPEVDVYSWRLRQPLPPIPVPLAANDPEVVLNLQAVFRETFDRAGFDYSLDYTLEVSPRLTSADEQWTRAVLVGQAGT